MEKDNGLACAMDSGGWFLIEELLRQVNQYIYPEFSRARPPITTSELALLASDGTENLTKTRWQLSVLMRSSSDRRHSTWCCRTVNTFGIRAFVGHTAVGFS